MPEISFVFDRTPADLSRAKELIEKIKNEGYASLSAEEKFEWDNGLKACRNASDLNRISNAINIISGMMHDGGLIDFQFNLRINWSVSEIPNILDIYSILGDTDVLRSVVELYAPNIPTTPDMPLNTIEKMNTVERILYEVYNITNIILTDRQVCGEDYRCYSEAQVSDLDGRLI